MELSAPRWGDDPTLLPPHPEPAGNGFADLAERLDTLAAPPADPPSVNEALPRVLAAAKLTGSQQVPVTLWAERLRTYLGLREAAKDGLLLGMAVMRQALVELGRRTELGADLFYATPTEIGAMVAASGTASPELRAALIRRKRERRAALSLEVPAALFSDDLAAIGRALPVPEGAHVWSGTPVSAGTAEAAALVRLDPRDPAPPGLEGYVLVCPSTDPAWVPLFARAKALVLETGGVLSHGAIVAREFGLPAVAGLPGVTRELKDGDRVRVDGGRGTVTRLEEG